MVTDGQPDVMCVFYTALFGCCLLCELTLIETPELRQTTGLGTSEALHLASFKKFALAQTDRKLRFCRIFCRNL